MAILGLVRTISATHGTKNVHGHDFRIEIQLEGPVVDDMVQGIDFHEVQKAVNSLLDGLEGKYLNDVIGRATVETIAAYVIKQLPQWPIDSVTVWEAADRYARLFTREVRH